MITSTRCTHYVCRFRFLFYGTRVPLLVRLLSNVDAGRVFFPIANLVLFLNHGHFSASAQVTKNADSQTSANRSVSFHGEETKSVDHSAIFFWQSNRSRCSGPHCFSGDNGRLILGHYHRLALRL